MVRGTPPEVPGTERDLGRREPGFARCAPEEQSRDVRRQRDPDRIVRTLHSPSEPLQTAGAKLRGRMTPGRAAGPEVR